MFTSHPPRVPLHEWKWWVSPKHITNSYERPIFNLLLNIILINCNNSRRWVCIYQIGLVSPLILHSLTPRMTRSTSLLGTILYGIEPNYSITTFFHRVLDLIFQCCSKTTIVASSSSFSSLFSRSLIRLEIFTGDDEGPFAFLLPFWAIFFTPHPLAMASVQAKEITLNLRQKVR